MNSLIFEPDPGVREKAILILVAKTTPLSVSSKLVLMDALENIGITHHFQASLQLFLHAFLQEP